MLFHLSSILSFSSSVDLVENTMQQLRGIALHSQHINKTKAFLDIKDKMLSIFLDKFAVSFEIFRQSYQSYSLAHIINQP